MNQISMIIFVLLFSSGIFGVEISPKDGEDSPLSSEHRRTLLNIIWSCLATIFACTWLAVHPNVPGRNITTKGPISGGIERVKIMVTAILAPEAIVAWAAEQFIVAWEVCYRTDFSISSVINGWRGKKDKYSPNLTMAHGFILSMGGFCYTEIESISPSPSSSSKILSDHAASSRAVELSILELDDLDSHPHLVEKLEAVSAETIEDKSKGDALSKTFAILQISWFIVQCITRALQHLPITLLEVTALAFAGLSIITYCLWWNKPLNVKYHISLDRPDLRSFRLAPETEYECRPWIKRIEDGIWGFFVGIVHIAMGVGSNDHGTHDIGHGTFRFSSGSEDQQGTRFVILVGVGSLFGVFHCAAWSFSFPSHTEMVLWRFSSLAVLIGLFAAGSSIIVDEGGLPEWAQGLRIIPLSRRESRAWDIFWFLSGAVGMIAYIIARIMLIVLAFMQLRSLPPLAFHTVQWTTYIPHI
ncbi:uncharacterized protein ARMOST_22280 [Armillaria ostoyae]|uniref:Uncharacterized protein n=1 Tax=Armillaria ostoyae TaxID=47428 RepID=A0A284SCE6_ARMOS|nr:uncharacterized protein ARMOST_22280 [Armillaria ostoyae]